MPRILIIAYYYPPSHYIGAVRAINIVQSLADHGWNVDVLTTSRSHWEGRNTSKQVSRSGLVTEIRCATLLSMVTSEAPRKTAPVRYVVSRLSNRFFEQALKIEHSWAWYFDALKTVKEYGRNHRPDVVMCTMSPFFAGGLATKIGNLMRAPVVLDYRDLAVGNACNHFLESNRRFVEQESQWLESARLITTVSPSLTEIISERVSCPSKCKVLHNGYFAAEFVDLPVERRESFTITYAGTFYPPRRIIDPVFAAIRDLHEKSALGKWRFEYYGNWTDYITEKAKQYGIQQHVFVHGQVSRRESLAKLNASDLLVVITSVEDSAPKSVNGVVTGKLFDCLAVKEPILLVAPAGSDARAIVNETDSGEVASGGRPAEIAAAILTAKARREEYRFQSQAYSWKRLGNKFDGMLRECISQNNFDENSRAAKPNSSSQV